jgi:hypothetical protein
MDWVAVFHGAFAALVFVLFAFGLMRWFDRDL